MTRVLINTFDGREYSSMFPTLEEAEAWVAKHSSSKVERKVTIIDESQYDRNRKMKQLVARRDTILQATDWLFMSDVKTPSKHRKAYMEYRQYLRDLPSLIGNKDEIGIEEFDHWLKRVHPEEFMDGGDSDTILHRFTYYYR